jgi:hypothetical protein
MEPTDRRRTRRGQSLVESCIAIALICVVLIGILQVSQVLASREILHHAAARGARARVVGLNWWMVEKVIRLATIPNAGRMTVPQLDRQDTFVQDTVENARPGEAWSILLGIEPHSEQTDIELARAPEFLWAPNEWIARHILDYERWDTIHAGYYDHRPDTGYAGAGNAVRIKVTQRLPLLFPATTTFYADDEVPIAGEARMENHYHIYLDDRNW